MKAPTSDVVVATGGGLRSSRFPPMSCHGKAAIAFRFTLKRNREQGDRPRELGLFDPDGWQLPEGFQRTIVKDFRGLRNASVHAAFDARTGNSRGRCVRPSAPRGFLTVRRFGMCSSRWTQSDIQLPSSIAHRPSQERIYSLRVSAPFVWHFLSSVFFFFLV